MTLGHIEDPDVAFVQTPQYYANGRTRPDRGGRGRPAEPLLRPDLARQGRPRRGLLLRHQRRLPPRGPRGRRRFPRGVRDRGLRALDPHARARLAQRLRAQVLACGLGPEDMASYVSQQQRWARGCLGSIGAVLRARLPWRLRLQYLLSATYFLSGLTLVVYMSLPVARIAARRAAAGRGDRRPVPAALRALLLRRAGDGGDGRVRHLHLRRLRAGRPDRSGSTYRRRSTRCPGGRRASSSPPSTGPSQRQPRAVAPALFAIAVLIGVSAWGLSKSHGAATLNNVAFAMLHASVLATAVIPALTLRPSAPLLPDPAPPRRRPAAAAHPRGGARPPPPRPGPPAAGGRARRSP